MARGTRKVFFAGLVELVNPGAGVDSDLVKLGYKRDAAIAPGSYPNPGASRVASQNAMVTQVMSFVRKFQSLGLDCRGTVFYKIFGADATNPVRALGGGEDDETEVMRIDIVEYSVRQKVNLANRELSEAGDIDDQLPQDLDIPLGGD